MRQSVFSAFSLILILAMASSSIAGGRGAVKIDFDPDVGWVMLNTTASGSLNATAHLESALPNEEFDVSVRVRYEDGSVEALTNIATISTNGQGKGDVQIRLDLNPPAGSETVRRVAFRVRRPGPPVMLYVAVAWDLPLRGRLLHQD